MQADEAPLEPRHPQRGFTENATTQMSPDPQKPFKRLRLLYRLQDGLETPLLVLALVWLWMLIAEFAWGLGPVQQAIVAGIWAVFVFDFLLEFALAPRKLTYLRRNWLTALALLVPALRLFRIVAIVRVLRTGQVVAGTNAFRAFTSGNRLLRTLRQVEGPAPAPKMNVGIVLAHSRDADKEALRTLAANLRADIAGELRTATGMPWHFTMAASVALEHDAPRAPSDFLDQASLAMAEGSFDLVLVVTNVALVSRRQRVEPGLSSPLCRMAVISARQLTGAGRAESGGIASSDAVRFNAAALALHLLGHIGGLTHGPGGMEVFAFDEQLREPPAFSEDERWALAAHAADLPERELRNGNLLEEIVFHLLMAARNPRQVLKPLLRNRAPLLSLSLPRLATAAAAPTLLLVFTAEIWDAGLGMSNTTAAVYAAGSIVVASTYMVLVQSLFLPRKEKSVITEHLAVANVVIFLSVVLMLTGLFLLVGLLMLLIELYIFPQDLMSTWPTLEQPGIELGDKIRLAAFISTIGVTTGALAGGLESRAVIQHLALFEDVP